jgi:hypothetical protein
LVDREVVHTVADALNERQAAILAASTGAAASAADSTADRPQLPRAETVSYGLATPPR